MVKSKEASSITVFIHRSIKTRIETAGIVEVSVERMLFLYIDPLKQGLKLREKLHKTTETVSFYT